MSEREYQSRLQSLKPFLTLFTVVIGSALLASCGGGGSSNPTASSVGEDSPTKMTQAVSGSATVPGTWIGRKPKVSILKTSFGAEIKPDYKLIGLGGSVTVTTSKTAQINGVAFSRAGSKISGLTAKVNGHAANNISLDDKGNFSFVANLNPGENAISITVRDANGLYLSGLQTIILDDAGLISNDLRLSDDKLAVGVIKTFEANIRLSANTSIAGDLSLVDQRGEVISKLVASGDGWYKSSFQILGTNNNVCVQAKGRAFATGYGITSGIVCIRAFKALGLEQVNGAVRAEGVLEAAFRRANETSPYERAIGAVGYISSSADGVLFSSLVVDSGGVVRYSLPSGYSSEFKYIPDGFLGASAIPSYPQIHTTALIGQPNYANADVVADMLEATIDSDSFPMRRRKTTISDLKDFVNFGDSGLINIMTHGNVVNGIAYLDTGIIVSDSTPYLDDLAAGDLRLHYSWSGSPTLYVSANYLRRLLAGRRFSGTVILLTACRSAALPDFQLLFTELGASAVIGYDNIIRAESGIAFAQDLVQSFSAGEGLRAVFDKINAVMYSSAPVNDVFNFYKVWIKTGEIPNYASTKWSVHPILYVRPGIGEIYAPTAKNCGSITSPTIIGQQGPLYNASLGNSLIISAIAKARDGYPFLSYRWETTDGGEGGGPTPDFSYKFISPGPVTVTVTPILENGTICTPAASSSVVNVSKPEILWSRYINNAALNYLQWSSTFKATDDFLSINGLIPVSSQPANSPDQFFYVKIRLPGLYQPSDLSYEYAARSPVGEAVLFFGFIPNKTFVFYSDLYGLNSAYYQKSSSADVWSGRVRDGALVCTKNATSIPCATSHIQIRAPSSITNPVDGVVFLQSNPIDIDYIKVWNKGTLIYYQNF